MTASHAKIFAETETLRALLHSSQQDVVFERGIHHRNIENLRSSFSFLSHLFPGGYPDVAQMQSLLDMFRHLIDADASGILSIDMMLDRYREVCRALLHFLDEFSTRTKSS